MSCAARCSAHVAKPAHDVVAVVGTRRYRVGAHHLRRYVDDARRALGDGLRWSTGRERLRSQVAEDVRRQREDAGGAPSDADTARVARASAVGEFLNEVWPALSAPALLSRLFDDAQFLRRCSASTLSDAERALLARPAARSVARTPWTPADAVLLDELAGLLDGMDTYVHAVVDEAQDLSAMQCRAIARRCPIGSLTVLGDLAQATTPWATGDWAETLRHLGHPGATVRPLTAGYRVPGEVLDIANRLLPHIADVPPATSIRRGEESLRFAAGTALVEELRRMLQVEGSVGVIVAGRRPGGHPQNTSRGRGRRRRARRRGGRPGFGGAGESGQGLGVRLGRRHRARRHRRDGARPSRGTSPPLCRADPRGVAADRHSRSATAGGTHRLTAGAAAAARGFGGPWPAFRAKRTVRRRSANRIDLCPLRKANRGGRLPLPRRDRAAVLAPDRGRHRRVYIDAYESSQIHGPARRGSARVRPGEPVSPGASATSVYTCSGSPGSPGVLHSANGPAQVSGFCQVSGGTTVINGTLTVAAGLRSACGIRALATARQCGDVRRQRSDVHPGLRPEEFQCMDDPNLIGTATINGGLFSDHPLGVILHHATVIGNVVQTGGGGGVNCNPSGIFAAFQSPRSAPTSSARSTGP